MFLLFFWINLFFPPFYRPPSESIHCRGPLYVCYNRYRTLLLMQSAAHLDISCTRHYLTSAVRLCAPRRVLASTTFSHGRLPPPLPPLACAQVPVGTWGVCLLKYPSIYPLPPPSHPLMILRIITSSSYWSLCLVAFHARAREKGTFTPWKLFTLYLVLPATWPCRLS